MFSSATWEGKGVFYKSSKDEAVIVATHIDINDGHGWRPMGSELQDLLLEFVQVETGDELWEQPTRWNEQGERNTM